ncbi:hypothetical protein AVEN_262054-1 [Araneus ventricosus]|uniref:Uncharacterized protein n=1 Tax=Araneus ventricosus TaxID=182803 RepID=A0A4Y2NMH9_ARAVE|nr:hypothetical protein AVEN_262054-1 [Araneus ventricosus]
MPKIWGVSGPPSPDAKDEPPDEKWSKLQIILFTFKKSDLCLSSRNENDRELLKAVIISTASTPEQSICSPLYVHHANLARSAHSGF